MTLALDILLSLGLLWLGWQVVSGRELFRSIVMLIVLGLLMAVVWSRLGAPDLALAEAAVGAAVTGAMLLLAYRRIIELRPERAHQSLLRRSRLAAPLALLCGALVMGLGYELLKLSPPAGSAGAAALEAIRLSELTNPVTGVLLLYRGYDTLLEMGVLLAAWLGVKMVQPADRHELPVSRTPLPTYLTDALLAVVIPGVVLVAGYLLHAGGSAPGGAFQAGAVLAGAGVLLVLTGRLSPAPEPSQLQRVALVLGVVTFAAIASVGPAFGKPVMWLPEGWVLYVIEAAMTISIAMCLLLLFISAGGVRRREP